jgi:hypothetical protein
VQVVFVQSAPNNENGEREILGAIENFETRERCCDYTNSKLLF